VITEKRAEQSSDLFGSAEWGATRKKSPGKHTARGIGVVTPLPGRCGLSFHDVPPIDLFRRSAVLGWGTAPGDVLV